MRDGKIRFTALAGVVAACAVALTACGSGESFESELRDAAAKGEFRLPSTTPEGHSWRKVMVLCPYDGAPKGVDASLAAEAATTDTSSSDADQWLLYRTGDGVEKATVSRSGLDFCSDAVRDTDFTPQDRWQGRTTEGGISVVPAA